jgi:hypothetical protein
MATVYMEASRQEVTQDIGKKKDNVPLYAWCEEPTWRTRCSYLVSEDRRSKGT